MRNQISSLNLDIPEQSEMSTIELTPLLDIVFILLIFFIVLVALSKMEANTLAVRQIGLTESDVGRHVSVHVSPDGKLIFDGRQMPLESLRFYLHPMPSKVDIVADPKTQAKQLTALMAELVEFGVEDLSLSVER